MTSAGIEIIYAPLVMAKKAELSGACVIDLIITNNIKQDD